MKVIELILHLSKLEPDLEVGEYWVSGVIQGMKYHFKPIEKVVPMTKFNRVGIQFGEREAATLEEVSGE